METTTSENSLSQAQLWLSEGKSFDEIEQLLAANNISENEIETTMKHIKDIRYEEHRKRGLPYVLFGALLCITGAVVAVCTFESGGTGFHIALYGMTGLGVTCIVGGLAHIFG